MHIFILHSTPLTQEERNLPSNPMPLFINTQPPNQQPQARQHGSGITHPQPHLRSPFTVVPLREEHYQPIAQSSREEDLGDNGPEDEAEEEETLDLQFVGCVCCGLHREEGADPVMS